MRLLLALVVCLPLLATEALAQNTVDIAKADAAWRAWVKQNGVRQSTLVITLRGKTVHSAGINRSVGAAIGLGSLAKPITGVCITKLVQSGKLGFQTTLGQVFGAKLEKLGLNAAHNADITVAQLISQTSGLKPDRTQKGGVRRFYGSAKSGDEQVGKTALKARRSKSAVGKFFYNNENYQILGLVISEVTGQAAVRACARLTGIPSLKMSTYFGVVGAASGWRASSTDYMRFIQKNLTGRSAVGANLAGFPKGRRNGRSFYGVGGILFPKRSGRAYVEHHGHFRDGRGKVEAALFFVWPNGTAFFMSYDGQNDPKKITALYKAFKASTK